MRWQKYIFERVDIVWFNLPGLMCVDLKIAFFSVFVQSVRVLYMFGRFSCFVYDVINI